MLAENEDHPELCKKAFDMNYGWGMHSVMHKVAQGKDSVSSIIRQVMKVDSMMPKNAFQMNFITNHDENSWNGTAREKFGDGENAFAVLTYVLPGMPLIYSGQEAGLNKRLSFFTKDSINWKTADLAPYYVRLNDLKHRNEALWNAPYGGTFGELKNSQPSKVLSFMREKGDHRVVYIANLSNQKVTVKLNGKNADGEYLNIFTDKDFSIKSSDLDLPLEPWSFMVLEKK